MGNYNKRNTYVIKSEKGEILEYFRTKSVAIYTLSKYKEFKPYIEKVK